MTFFNFFLLGGFAANGASFRFLREPNQLSFHRQWKIQKNEIEDLFGFFNFYKSVSVGFWSEAVRCIFVVNIVVNSQ